MPRGTRKRRREPSPAAAAAAGERKLLPGEVVEVRAPSKSIPSYRRSVPALLLRGWLAWAGLSFGFWGFPVAFGVVGSDQSRDQTNCGNAIDFR